MSDIGLEEVVQVAPDGSRQVAVERVPGKPGGLGFLPCGDLIVVSMIERALYRVRDGRLILYCNLAHMAPKMLNDMVIDSMGKAYVGNSGFNPFAGDERLRGSIILVEEGKEPKVVAEDLGFPNGMVLTSTGYLFAAESSDKKLSCFRVSINGELSGQQTESVFDGRPDGCCLDLAGGIWIGLIDRERFIRVLSGQVTDVIHTPGRRAVACQLGGPDKRTLYCLTQEGVFADIGKRRTALLETVRVDIPGAGSP